MTTKNDLIKELIDFGYLKTPRIVEAFRAIDRVDFVRDEYKDEAYENYPLPIGGGQTISQPLTVAFMLELLSPKPGEKILDMGAGSGWQSCLLAYIASKPRTYADKTRTVAENPRESACVVAVERIKELCEFAKENIEKYKFISNGIVKFYCEDATAGLPAEGPFDKIIAAAAASRDIPEEWKNQLKPGGKIVAPVGGSIWFFEKTKEGEWKEQEFPGFAFVPLIKDK